ncbi:MAG: glucosaminidase domain-containing protein [Alphaproteobacteria bacterium]
MSGRLGKFARQNLVLAGLGAAVTVLYGLALLDLSGPAGHRPAATSAITDLARSPVPRQFAIRLTTPMPADTGTRKQLFLATVLPLVLRVNENIRADRARLRQLRALVLNGRLLALGDAVWLQRLADRYAIENGDFTSLLRRVDAIPPSLVLAQAATESGWGSSRFAQQGNALFGQRTWAPGGGLVPAGRAAGGTYEVQRFDDLAAGIRAYVHNLNRHPAYADFRALRATHKPRPDPLALAATLSAYSELGAGYVELLHQVIQENNLTDLDTARLDRP